MAEQAYCAHARLNRRPIYSRPGLVVGETWACSECEHEPLAALTARLSSAEAEVEKLKALEKEKAGRG